MSRPRRNPRASSSTSRPSAARVMHFPSALWTMEVPIPFLTALARVNVHCCDSAVHFPPLGMILKSSVPRAVTQKWFPLATWKIAP